MRGVGSGHTEDHADVTERKTRDARILASIDSVRLQLSDTSDLFRSSIIFGCVVVRKGYQETSMRENAVRCTAAELGCFLPTNTKPFRLKSTTTT